MARFGSPPPGSGDLPGVTAVAPDAVAVSANRTGPAAALCPLCERDDCADEVEAYLHHAARGTGEPGIGSGSPRR